MKLGTFYIDFLVKFNFLKEISLQFTTQSDIKTTSNINNFQTISPAFPNVQKFTKSKPSKENLEFGFKFAHYNAMLPEGRYGGALVTLRPEPLKIVKFKVFLTRL